MASSHEDLCQIITANEVNSLLKTLYYDERKFIVWTRLSLENSSWVINCSDGVDVWILEMDKGHLDSYMELTHFSDYENFFTKIRSDFHCNDLMIGISDKISLTFGTSQSPLTFELYEASIDERKTELQYLIFWMADDIIQLNEKLKVSAESIERLTTQKESNPSTCSSSIFDLPAKKVVAPTVKRKQGYSLVNPGSRNNTDPVTANLETTVHPSVLGDSQMLDVFRCPNPLRCQFPCNKSSRRYHCPLCDNRPQKPGRMRRHFFTMHAGKHVIEHEGFRILRCKLKCSRANGRITDCSHYHCSLCGRVCLRKVHLCCHLQAHALGTAKDVEDEMMDASKADEDPEEEEGDDDDDGDDQEDTAEETVLQTSQMACSMADSEQTENVVTLTDGTQVVYVQSMDNGETLTVVPVSSQSDSIDMQATADQLSSSLQVLAASQPANQMQELGAMAPGHQGDQDLEAILNQGQGRVESLETSVTSVSSIATAGMPSFHTYTAHHPGQTQDPPRQTLSFDQSYSELTNEQGSSTQEGDAQVVFGVTPTTTASDIQKAPHLTEVPCELAHQGDPMAVELPNVANSLDMRDLVASTPIAVPQVPSIVGSHSIQSTSTTPTTSTPMLTSESSTSFSNPSFSEGDQSYRNYKTPDNDYLLLLKGGCSPQEDDHVFSKLFTHTKPRVENIIQHASVIPEQSGMEVSRCKNTECDCRLYHCPLCTCLPNKPGRIKEHFRKIHSEHLIIRYQGYQMLRCKLGCCRTNGKRILNSHYHCCLCGCICISKSGVYEHIRTQHSEGSLKSEAHPHDEKRKNTTPTTAPPSKKRAVEENQSPSKAKPASHIQRPLVVQLPNSNQAASGSQSGLGQQEGMGSQQPMVIQVPQMNEAQDGTQQQQPLVILMPQQLHNYNQGSNQQPIVIVMPQGGSSGGGTMQQPIIVPMPQTVNN